jgi:Na+/glutamate symporter
MALLVTVVTGAVLLTKTATSRLVLAGLLGGSVVSCAMRRSTQEMARQQAPLGKIRIKKKKKKMEKKKKKKGCKKSKCSKWRGNGCCCGRE